MTIWILSGVITVLTVLLCASIYYNIKFGIKILSIQDSIQDALNVLDSREESMNKILQTPLFYDSPEIRQLHDDLTRSRNAILHVADDLVGSINRDELAESVDADPNTDTGDDNAPV
jgi:hypothetical protein